MSALADPHSVALPAADRHADDDSSWLGIALGEANWLLDPADVAEAIPVPHLAPVPFTRAWFAGVACIRGVPLAVVDLHAFFTATTLQAAEHARLVVVADRYRINSALLVARVLGLEPRARFVREPEAIPASAPWIEGHYRDEEGRRWAALDMARLLSHPSFLRIEEPVAP